MVLRVHYSWLLAWGLQSSPCHMVKMAILKVHSIFALENHWKELKPTTSIENWMCKEFWKGQKKGQVFWSLWIQSVKIQKVWLTPEPQMFGFKLPICKQTELRFEPLLTRLLTVSFLPIWLPVKEGRKGGKEGWREGGKKAGSLKEC